MSFTCTTSERRYLWNLARRQAEYAALPVMQTRQKMWFDLNDGVEGTRPPVIVEAWTFDRDFMPDSIFQCQSPDARTIERQLLRNLRKFECINDDTVMPDSFEIDWFVDIDEFGFKVERERVKDAQGYETGYRFLHPITDLERDLEQLRLAQCRVDRGKTRAWQTFVESMVGDWLPVVIRGRIWGNPMLTHRVVELMGMQAFFMAMYDQPEALHRLMAYLRDNALRVMQWSEDEDLLRLNNRNQSSFGSSYNFTHRLPVGELPGGKVRLCDMWGAVNSQETVGVSPAMFTEFCAPYYGEVCAPMGQVYYGCCEPVHPFWDDVRRMPHLKKVSISRWCDETFMGQALQGTGIVYSRKPDPGFLGTDVVLDEERWRCSIRDTLCAARGVPVEFIVRDVYTVHGNLNKPRRAVEIAREEIEKFL